MFTTFFDAKEPLTASSLITAALNIGRDDVFKDNDDDIYGYQYSAILDDRVCKICEDLDGSVVTNAEYMATIWMPPVHFNCRCLDNTHKVLSRDGEINIADVKVGDYLLTHQNRYRKVLGRSERLATEIYEIETDHGTIRCTPEHPILTDRGWSKLKT